MATRFTKDPQARLDYGFDWSPWLVPGDTITAVTWTIDGPDENLVQDTPSHTDKQVVVWLSAGTLDNEYEVTAHVTTSQSRVDDRFFIVKIENR